MSVTCEDSFADDYSSRPNGLAEIELSLRLAVFHGIAASAVWLLIGSLCLMVSGLQLVSPAWFADCPYLNHGKISVVSDVALVYGFALQILATVGIYLTCRMSRKKLRHPFTWFAASKIWNLGVLLGAIGVFLGDATGHEHFALPVYSSALLMLSGLAMAFKHLLVVHYRSDRSFHPAQLLLSAGVFWFLWVLATAIVVLQCKPVAGIAQLVVARWYANGVFQVVLGAGGLGTLMYFLPQLMGRPLASRELAVTAFWTLLIVGGWTGLSGRWPLPVWIGGVSSIAAFMMLVPLLAVGVNIWQTVRPDFGRVVGSTQGRFFLIGAASYLVWLAVHVAFGANSFNELLGQTHFESAREVLFIYGFVAAVGIGAVSVILPRLAGVECNCSGVKIIFQLLIAGLLLSVIGFGLAGAAQGTAWANGSLDFAAVNRAGGGMLQLALVGLGLLTLAAAMFLVGTTVVMLRSIYAEYPVLKWTEDEQVEQTEKVTA